LSRAGSPDSRKTSSDLSKKSSEEFDITHEDVSVPHTDDEETKRMMPVKPQNENNPHSLTSARQDNDKESKQHQAEFSFEELTERIMKHELARYKETGKSAVLGHDYAL
jgi:preprotein translocase subunit SecD